MRQNKILIGAMLKVIHKKLDVRRTASCFDYDFFLGTCPANYSDIHDNSLFMHFKPAFLRSFTNKYKLCWNCVGDRYFLGTDSI